MMKYILKINACMLLIFGYIYLIKHFQFESVVKASITLSPVFEEIIKYFCFLILGLPLFDGILSVAIIFSTIEVWFRNITGFTAIYMLFLLSLAHSTFMYLGYRLKEKSSYFLLICILSHMIYNFMVSYNQQYELRLLGYSAICLVVYIFFNHFIKNEIRK